MKTKSSRYKDLVAKMVEKTLEPPPGPPKPLPVILPAEVVDSIAAERADSPPTEDEVRRLINAALRDNMAEIVRLLQDPDPEIKLRAFEVMLKAGVGQASGKPNVVKSARTVVVEWNKPK